MLCCAAAAIASTTPPMLLLSAQLSLPYSSLLTILLRYTLASLTVGGTRLRLSWKSMTCWEVISPCRDRDRQTEGGQGRRNSRGGRKDPGRNTRSSAWLAGGQSKQGGARQAAGTEVLPLSSLPLTGEPSSF